MTATPRLETLTRAGFAARGVMYGLIGFLALKTGRTEDGAGAMRFLSEGSGKLVLAVMAVGFIGYGIWRIAEAAFDSEGHGSDAKGVAVRAGGAVSGVIHFILAYLAARLAMGSGGGGGNSAQESTATALDLPGGALLVGLAGAALLAVGAFQLVKAVRGDFLKQLDQRAAGQDWVKWLGRAGYAARGIVFLLMGWFLAQAGFSADAGEAGGMGEALSALPPTLRLVVAAGLFLFGLFSFVEARHRRIADHNVAGRLKAMT
jgi:hypothetical protein